MVQVVLIVSTCKYLLGTVLWAWYLSEEYSQHLIAGKGRCLFWIHVIIWMDG